VFHDTKILTQTLANDDVFRGDHPQRGRAHVAPQEYLAGLLDPVAALTIEGAAAAGAVQVQLRIPSGIRPAWRGACVPPEDAREHRTERIKLRLQLRHMEQPSRRHEYVVWSRHS
jgi:hypothetical protein